VPGVRAQSELQLILEHHFRHGNFVIEQTIRQKLPPGFQRSEFLLQHGFLDAVVPRNEMRVFISRALRFFCA